MSNKENYPIGYSSNVIQHFLKRSAQNDAGFLIPYLKEENILLDCGCGPGSITLDLASILSQGKVIGIDMESSQIERAKSLAKERNIQNAKFQTADLLHLPFENNTFDVAFTHAVLWTIRDFFRLLKN
jgi:ubiquinone/menaquinone biosynthesis C-methylase UbiE